MFIGGALIRFSAKIVNATFCGEARDRTDGRRGKKREIHGLFARFDARSGRPAFRFSAANGRKNGAYPPVLPATMPAASEADLGVRPPGPAARHPVAARPKDAIGLRLSLANARTCR